MSVEPYVVSLVRKNIQCVLFSAVDFSDERRIIRVLNIDCRKTYAHIVVDIIGMYIIYYCHLAFMSTRQITLFTHNNVCIKGYNVCVLIRTLYKQE